MADDRSKSSGSFLLLDEHFAAGNDAFLNELCAITDARQLGGFADRWKNDPRPWAREKIFDYLNRPLATPGHNVVVKRLFKQAEKQRDSQLMAAFLHAFDCLVRRQRRMKWHWDRATQQPSRDEVLYAPKDNLRPVKPITVGRNPRTGEPIQIARHLRTSGKLFSYRTRYYLRRRVWRDFRFLGYRSPSEFPAAIAAALIRYTDEDLAKGEHILDSWCLLNICFRQHPALTFTPSHVKLNEGRSLNELTPAPKLAKAWAAPAAAEVLWSLLPAAQSRLVRLWTIQMLHQHHAAFLASLNPAKLLPLFDSLDADVQQMALQILEKLPGLANLPLATWLQLLRTQDPLAQATICGLMVRHVTAERLDVRQAIDLANSASTPVANLGLVFLRSARWPAPTTLPSPIWPTPVARPPPRPLPPLPSPSLAPRALTMWPSYRGSLTPCSRPPAPPPGPG